MNEYVIKEGGELVKRTTSEVPIDINDSIKQAFQQDTSFSLFGIADLSMLGQPFFGNCGVTMSTSEPSTTYWSVRVKTLVLNTTFHLNGEVMTPTFAPNDSTEKVIEMMWRPPESMWLTLGITMFRKPDGFVLGKHYLYASDSSNRRWMPPLANVYETCELCHGQMQDYHPTMMKALMAGTERFRSSRWNADLFRAFQQDCAPRMFRFKPSNTGFDQLPLDSNTDWTKLCQKVSTELLNNRFMSV